MDQDTALNDQNVKDVIASLFDEYGDIKAVLADGKIGITDLPHLIPIVKGVGDITGKLNAAREELQHLNETEIADLATFIGAKVGGIVPTANLVEKVTTGINAAHAVLAFVQAFKK